MDKSVVLNTEGAESTLDVDKCYICLSPFTEQTVASLDNCQHLFCLQCIHQWSQTANTCPVDRIRFAFIHPGGDTQKKIKVRTHKKDDDDDEEEERSHAVICEECGRSDRRHRLLVCTHCDSGYHMDCLTPSLNTDPEGDWVCPECVLTAHHTGGSAVEEEEISDGELTDLLAELDETPSTSSRLRPSTINQPSGSAGRRRSQRIQSRAGSSSSSSLNPRPQTSWHVPKYLLRASKPAVTTDEAVSLQHGKTSKASVELKTRKRRKRAT